ncbi:ERAD-associated protein [Aspergillus nanangensis]|uniref:ERAD-associated protein n=1 Tax=Aspergillus nanangensis TaxID=2582783 RepID=A0AAD4CE68_ASPNN|nr:ERAD-associated protein [Aspergillus nanangensis]
MKDLWLRRLFPLALLLLQAFLVQSKDVEGSTSMAVAAESQQPFAQSYESTSHRPRNEHVNTALNFLNDPSISLTTSERPSGLVGYALYYTKATFRILFMNGPLSDSGNKHKTHPLVTKAVKELETAVRDDHDPEAMFLLAEMNFHGNFTHPRDFKQAFHWYQSLASLDGNSTSQYMLGFMYATGIGGAVKRDQAKAILYHTFAAEAGNTRSEMTLAYWNHVGVGMPQNCDEATYYYKKVADKAIDYYRSGPPGGHSMPRESYRWADEEGGVYGEGASVSSSGPNAPRESPSSADASLEDVLEYLDLMSRKGELKATFSLGKMHYEGARELPRNFRKAMRYFKIIANRYWNKDGSVNPSHPYGIEKLAAKAAGHIGMMYLRGEGVDQTFSTAATWFKRGVANGDALCQHELGLMYLHGYGLTQDAFRAASYFISAADQDLPASETRVGALFLDQGDVATATRYFELAARWGWMEAFYYLAELSNNGVGRQRHCGVAVSYYKMVAERVEAIHSSFPEANTAYEHGEKERALVASMMAAEQGYETAQANVAFLLDEQRSLVSLSSIVPGLTQTRTPLLRNAALALVYWTRSARQANIDSLIKMGDYYLSGAGIAADADKASACYHTAAEAHFSAQAYWNLGWMHENGVSVHQDFHMAKRYYDLALETSVESYLPVKLSLLKLRLRSYWNRITNGSINPIRDDEEVKPRRTFKEWIATFLENDEEEEANYRAQMYKRAQEEEDDLLSSGSESRHEDGYYDDLDLEIDESVLEGLIIVALAATLLILLYVRQNRNPPPVINNNGGNQQGGDAAAENDRGFFPRPGNQKHCGRMASINLNGKRRRAEQAASALSKPFKSPLRRPVQQTSTPQNPTPVKLQSCETSSACPTGISPSTPTTVTEKQSTTRPLVPTSPTTPVPTISPQQTSLPSRKRQAPSNYLLPAKKPFLSDPEVLYLQKQQRVLQSRLATLRSELDTAQQALRLESSTKDIELENLIGKWRVIGQNAAEEVFTGAQDRVARMGGLKAWKERMKNDTAQWEREEMEAWYGNEEKEAFSGAEGELESRRAEMMEQLDVVAMKKKKKSDDNECQVVEENEEEEEFTMDVMLKTLNIALKTIGYDKDEQNCGECQRRGTECLPVKSSKDGEDITVPLKYLKHLESRLADLENRHEVPGSPRQVRDIGVQTDLPNSSHAEDGPIDNHPLDHTPGGWRGILQQMLSNPKYHQLDQPPMYAPAPGQDFMLLSDPRAQPQNLEGPLISRLAYEFYQVDMSPESFSHNLSGSPQTISPAGWSSFYFEEIYTKIYFSITHWVWPFVDRDAWKSWRHDWSLSPETDQWKGFFVQMVYAVGALSCNALQPNQGHSTRAAELYTSALACYPFVMGHPSTILQIQASIFMILYALQCPSSEEIATTVSSIVPFCIASIAEIQKHALSDVRESDDAVTGTGEILTESLFITCYMLNEITVSGWERPVSAAYQAIEDDLNILSNEMPASSSTNKALKHLFRLRKIQWNIRQSLAEEPPQQESSDKLFRSELAAWRQEIPQYGIGGSPSTYLHPLWMANLYDYSIIILSQEKRHRLKYDDIEEIVSAGIEVCINFRRLQEEGQVMCYTWSALVFQFRAGTMLLYILWNAYGEGGYMEQASEALWSCTSTLSHFADRWPDAVPYFRVFDFLLQHGPWVEDGHSYASGDACTIDELGGHLEQLKKQYLHKAVLETIEDLVHSQPGKSLEDLLDP